MSTDQVQQTISLRITGQATSERPADVTTITGIGWYDHVAGCWRVDGRMADSIADAWASFPGRSGQWSFETDFMCSEIQLIHGEPTPIVGAWYEADTDEYEVDSFPFGGIEVLTEEPEPPVEMPDEPAPRAYARFGRYVAALLGASAEWDDPAGYLEDIAQRAQNDLRISIGDQDEPELALWRSVADELGIGYDEED